MRDLPWSLRTTSAPLGHKGVSDAKQICDAGGIKLLHICPATNNLPTRMTRAAWATLCAATQRKARERIDKNQQYLMRMTKRLNVCALCQGKTLPRGLEFIEAAEMAELSKPKEEAMAEQSKLGVCENCGDKGALTGSFGRRVCSTCLRIRSNVNSHLPKIATAARDMGKGQELLAALVPDGGGLAIQVTADLLQDISDAVGYRGEDPAELVEAVRRRALACASCDAEDVLHEIREIVGYVPEQGDKGLADMVRQLVARPSVDCGKCTPLRVDLLRACGLETEDTEGGEGLDTAVAAALQEIAHLTDRREFWASAATKIKVKAGDLKSELLAKRGEIEELRSHIAIGESQLEKLRAELTLAQQARDEWEQRCAAAEESMLDVEVDLHERDELAHAGAEVERLRDRAQESESRLIWYREALQVLRDRLGLDHLGEDEDVVERMLEAIASQAQALTRFQELARAADVRAEHLEGELERQIGVNEAQAAVERELRATIAEQSADFERLRNQDLAGNGRYWSTDDSPLLDVALAVIRDEPVPADRIATLIDLARRASA